jgi:hypothetical protein
MAKADSAKAKMGRPPKYDKDFHPQDFIEQSKKGKSKTQIASSWDISRDTLYDWAKTYKEFSYAIKVGNQHAQNWWEELGVKAMLNQVTVNGVKTKADLGYFVWLSKNMFGWRDKPDVEPDDNDLDLDFNKDA